MCEKNSNDISQSVFEKDFVLVLNYQIPKALCDKSGYDKHKILQLEHISLDPEEHTQRLLVLHVKTLYTINQVKNTENELVQAYRDRNMVHVYVNTPATAKLAREV